MLNTKKIVQMMKLLETAVMEDDGMVEVEFFKRADVMVATIKDIDLTLTEHSIEELEEIFHGLDGERIETRRKAE